jgi:hypothetical protein
LPPEFFGLLETADALATSLSEAEEMLRFEKIGRGNDRVLAEARLTEVERERDEALEDLSAERDAAEAGRNLREAIERDLAEAERVLEFYADPETYFAIAFAADPPCGDFADDFEELEGELGHPDGGAWIKPGKRARAYLDAHQRESEGT